ncbi:MAG: hypothetical protein JNL10_14585 [Verrucomicrobiales bacterium]|nr:hypothetical protein [Verrucomicrobiales bacterium]
MTTLEPHGPARGHFLNVDLEVHSGEDLSPLAAEFEARACVLHFEQRPGANSLVVEREDEPSGPGLEATLSDLCDLVESLSPPARGLWDRADLRVLDAGFDAAPGRPLAQFSVPPSLLRRVVAVNARIAVTVYPEDEWDASLGAHS